MPKPTQFSRFCLAPTSADDTMPQSPFQTPARHPNDTTQPNAKHFGLLPIYKPTNWTSSDVVAFVRKTLEMEAKNRLGTKKRPKIKVGHGGTLDPMAEGVLVLGVGKGTKMMSSYLSGTKSYDAVAEVGYETTTLDLEGEVVHRSDASGVTLPQVEDVSRSFTGTIMQKPPLFSAIHINGRRLYELAREGVKEVRAGAKRQQHITLQKNNIQLVASLLAVDLLALAVPSLQYTACRNPSARRYAPSYIETLLNSLRSSYI